MSDITEFCFKQAGIKQRKKLIEYLLEKSPKEGGNRKLSCHWCDPKGIELTWLNATHYDEFCDQMRKVFEKKVLERDGRNLDKEHEKFIKRLIKLEEYVNDLRIRDLDLRYESKSVQEKISKSLEAELHGKYCWPEDNQEEKIRQFELLPCLSTPEQIKSASLTTGQLEDMLPSIRYEQVMDQWDKYFLRHLESPSIHEKQESGLYFLGLQRWNSSSPAEGYSLGGGYLVYHLNESSKVDYGIAIDPGFDFIRNLFHMGFSLNDIDIILISHAHIDHIRDFESIITLLLELAKRKKKYRKVHVILTLGIYKRLEYIIENPNLRLHIEPYIIDIDREIDTDYFENLLRKQHKYSFLFKVSNRSNDIDNSFQPVISPESDYTLRVRPTRAYHDDHSGYSDSFGFLIDVRLPGEDTDVTIGYTGDTKWIYPKIEDPIAKERNSQKPREIEDIVEQYYLCDALIVHLGSLIDPKIGQYFREYNQCTRADFKTPCERLVREEGHPYIIGLLRILTSMYKQCNGSNGRKPLILVSEFGEELRGKIRVDLIRRLIKVYGEKMNLLPVDVGINVQLNQRDEIERIFCVQCNRFVAIGEADFEHYGPDEAIYCVCKACLKGTPFDVLQSRFRQLYEVGYELHSAKRND